MSLRRFSALIDLVRLVKFERSAVGFLVGFSSFINLLYIVPSLIIVVIYDRVLSTQSVETLVLLAVLATLVFVATFLLEWLRSVIVIRLTNRIDLELCGKVLMNSLRMKRTGDQAEFAGAPSDLMSIRQVMGGNFAFTLLDLPWVLVYLLILWLLHPAFAMAAVLGGTIVMLLALSVEKATYGDLGRARDTAGAAQRVFGNALRSSETIYAMGIASHYAARWGSAQAGYLIFQSAASDKGSLLTSMNKSVRLSLQFIPIALGAYLVLHHSLSPGVMFAASILTGRVLAPIDMISNLMKALQTASLSAENVKKIVMHQGPSEASVTLPKASGVITMEKVSIQPPGASEPSLKEISHRFQTASVTAVVGPSSSGKSSLAKAIVGAWIPLHGEVRIDGALFDQYSESQRGEMVGYLPQDVELLDGTIAENISRFQRVDSGAILEAAQAAGVHDLITRLPNGYDSQLVDGGRNLSGGFRQRLGLARAVFGSPRILVLDEPNSHLDESGEAALRNTILKMKQLGSTVVVITHRASLLSVVDNIMLIVDGRISKYGPRSEFVKQAPTAAAA